MVHLTFMRPTTILRERRRNSYRRGVGSEWQVAGVVMVEI
jgi:hypothetical protein